MNQITNNCKFKKKISKKKSWVLEHFKYSKENGCFCNHCDDFFSIVATSVPSESLFSHIGLIQTDIRNRLSPDTLENIVFLKENL